MYAIIGQGDGTKEHGIMAVSAPLDVWPKEEPIKPNEQAQWAAN